MTDTEEDQIRTVTINKWASSRVTAVLSVALLIALILVFLLTGSGGEIFHRSVSVRTYFDDGTGLVRTADVVLDGIKVGEVKSVRLNDTNDTSRAIEVRMNIRKDFLHSIPDDSKTEITADNLVGDKYINIQRGKSARSIVANDELQRVPPTPNFNPADLIASMQSILKRASDLLDQVENPQTPLGALVKGEDLYTNIRNDIKAVQDVITAYGSPKSPFGKAIYGQDLYNQIRKPVLEIDKQLADIENGQGTYGQMLKDSSQYDSALARIRDFRASVKQMRNTPMLTSDEQYRNGLQMLKQLNSAFDELTRGEGQLARLLDSTQLYEQYAGTSRETREFIRDFRLHPQKYLRLKVF